MRLGAFIQYVREELGDEVFLYIPDSLSVRLHHYRIWNPRSRHSGRHHQQHHSKLPRHSNFSYLTPDQFTIGSLQRAIDMLIARNLVCQKKDIATYAREQDAELNAQAVTSRPSRGRGGRATRGGRGGKVNRAAALVGEKEWKDLDRPVVKRRGKTLGDCLELPGKKGKDESEWGNGVTGRPAPKEALSAVDSERQSMLFCVNIERYTCILQQQLILQYVEERVGTVFRVDPS